MVSVHTVAVRIPIYCFTNFIFQFQESDLSTKRNAFLMLIHCDLQRAVIYALSVQDSIGCLGDIFQLAFLELLRRVSRENPSQIGSLLRIIVTLVDSCSPAVAYEGGAALVSPH